MCLKYCYSLDKKKSQLTEDPSEKVYKSIFCNSCNSYSYTNHLYKNYLGINGFCDDCWEKINNFKLDS